MVKFVQLLVFVTSSILLSACVTQNFDKDKPVIEKNSSSNELAITRVSLGLGYLKMGNTTQAKFNLEKAKSFSPKLVEVHTAFAHYFETVDEPELAIKSFQTALSIKPDDANTLNNYGVFLCRQERYVEAEKQFLKAIAIPSYLLVSESYENLASCQLKAGDFDKAERYLAKAVTHSPNRGSALFQMIRLEYAMGNYKKARRYSQKFEKVTRRFKPKSLALSLKVYQQLGNQKTAKNYGSMLVSMYPESWEAKQYILNGLNRIEADELAELYQASKAKDSKNKAKKRVIKLSPNGQTSVAIIKTKPQEVAEEGVANGVANIVKTTDTSVAIVNPLPKPAMKQASSSIIAPVAIASTTAITEAVVLTAKAAETNEVIDNVQEAQVEEDIVEKSAEQKVASNTSEQPNDDTDNRVSDNVGSEAVLAENTETLAVISSDSATAIVAATAVENITNNNEEVLAIDEVNLQEVAAMPQTTDNALNDSIVISDDTSTTDIEEVQLEQSAERAFHTVVKGDNLYGISIKYNTHMKALKKWNDFGDDLKIRIGDKIYIEEPLVADSLVAESIDE